MHPDLDTQRRVLVKYYRLYLDADQSWNAAVREAMSWFPAGRRPTATVLGNPGSHLRRRYEARERALQRLLAARDMLERARQRLVQQNPMRGARTRLLLLSV